MDKAPSSDDENTVFLTVPGKPARTLKSGDILGENYRLLELIGTGGMGVVYRCRHQILTEHYALKILRPDQVNEITWQRFRAEGKAIAKLEHPNIVKIFNMGTFGADCPYYVMELLEGVTLKSHLATHGPLSVDQALAIFYQLASGLGYAHSKGIVHRDVKPSNIVLQLESTGKYGVKIVDFGLAKLVDRQTFAGQSLTTAGEVFGSPLYMSPEQGLGQVVDVRSDIYSLGCTLFKALTGEPPYLGDIPFKVILMHQNQPTPSLASVLSKTVDRGTQTFPQGLEDLVQNMLAKHPEDRYQSMDEVCADISRLQKGKPLAIAGTKAARVIAAGGGQEEREQDQEAEETEESISKAKSLWPRIAVSLLLLLASGAAVTFYCQHQFGLGTAGGGANKTINRAAGSTTGSVNSIVVTPGTEGLSAHPDGTATTALSDPAMDKALADFAKFKPRDAHLSSANGMQLVTFYFPETVVGALENSVGERRRALGPVTMVFRQPISLEIRGAEHRFTWADPSILKKIGPSAINDLILTPETYSPTAPVSQSDDSLSEQRILEMLAIARHWTKLEGLHLHRCTITAKILAAVQALPHIVRFSAEEADNQVGVVTKYSFWGKLREVNFSGLNGVDSFITALKGCKNLKKVVLDRTTPSAAAIGALSECPNLKEMSVERTQVTDDELLALSELSQLEVLWMRHVPLSCKQLLKAPKLTHLTRISITLYDWKPAQMATLGIALPNCASNPERQGAGDTIE